jgi:hypothetical protein
MNGKAQLLELQVIHQTFEQYMCITNVCQLMGDYTPATVYIPTPVI